MKTSLAFLAKEALLISGTCHRRLRREVFSGVAVLCYHGVRADGRSPGTLVFADLHVRASELEAHCRFIRQTCHPISLARWRAALAGGEPLPARPVLFTFDDGYQTVFSVARPILKQYAIPAVLFVCSEPISQRRLHWYDAVARTRGEPEVERMKTLPYDDWRAATREWSQPITDAEPNAPLTVAELRDLAGIPGIEVGSHTADHLMLSRASREQQREQILSNKATLEEWLGRPVTAFGRPGVDYSAESVELVQESGFDFAFTTRQGFATPGERPLERSRFLMVAGLSEAELAYRLCFSWRRG